MTYAFKPDWTIAPAATLQEWLDEHGLDAARLGPDIAPAVVDVLDRQPLSPAHAACLERGTQVPARFWLALEHNYRAGLAAGLRDMT